MQAGVLGKSAGELDIKLAGRSGVPGSPFPSPAVAGLAVESSLVRDTEAREIPLLLHAEPFCAGGKQG